MNTCVPNFFITIQLGQFLFKFIQVSGLSQETDDI